MIQQIVFANNEPCTIVGKFNASTFTKGLSRDKIHLEKLDFFKKELNADHIIQEGHKLIFCKIVPDAILTPDLIENE